MTASLKHAFLRFVQQHKLFEQNKSVLIALSGGIDSMALLHLLLEWQTHLDLQLAALHINHQLRGQDSDQDQEFVEKFCQQKNLPIYVEKVDMAEFARAHQYSLEEAGHIRRELIYQQYLGEKKFDVVATAHNLNDQAETILMHILDGTGIEGLAGIRLQKSGVVRSLLFADRSEIEQYVRRNNIPFREDKSNLDLRFKRNKIRHELLPFLEREFSLNNLDSFLKMSLILQDWLIYSDNLLEAFKARLSIDKKQEKVSFNIEEYRRLFSGIQIKVLENILSRISGSPQSLNFNTFQGFQTWLEADKPGRRFQLQPEIWVNRHGEFLNFQRISDRLSRHSRKGGYAVADGAPSNKIRLEIPSENRYTLPDAGIQFRIKKVEAKQVAFDPNHAVEFVDAGKIKFPLILRNWESGDKFQPLGLSHERLVSDFLTDLKIEFPQKRHVLVLEQGGEIVAIPGYRISEKFKLTPKTRRAFKIELCSYEES